MEVKKQTIIRLILKSWVWGPVTHKAKLFLLLRGGTTALGESSLPVEKNLGENLPTAPVKVLSVPSCFCGITMSAAGLVLSCKQIRLLPLKLIGDSVPQPAGLPYQQQPDGAYQGHASHSTSVDPVWEPKN